MENLKTERSAILAASQANCIIEPLTLFGSEWRSYTGITQPFPPHAHDHYVIGVVRKGRRRLVWNGRECSLAPGDIVVFNPGDVHGCTQVSHELFAYDSIVLPRSIFGSAALPGPLHRTPAARAAFDELAHSARQAKSGKSMKAATQVFSDELLTLADEMPDAIDRAPSNAAAHRRNRAAALHAYGHLRGHMINPRSVSMLATDERISDYALIRAYKREFFITPSQHLLSMRVDFARDLLASGANPAEAAAEAGFSDQAHLTRAFKQRIGSTPAAYRAMSQGDQIR